MCEIHSPRLLQACSPGAPPTPMTGCYDFRRAWRPTPGQRPGTSACRPPILEALLLDRKVTLPGQVCLDCCCQSGNFLLRCNESRMVGLAVLFLLLGGHQLLQNANDLAALWCVHLTGTARQERKQRGTTSSNHFDIQSRRSHHHESHGFSCRSPALILNFSPL